MNLYLNIDDFKQNNQIQINDNIRFLYAKQNTIMDGKFTKILYSDDCVIMNGFYILFPIVCDKYNPHNSNNIRFIQYNKKSNIQLIEYLSQLENKILTQYQKYNNCDKYKDPCLQKQLYNKQFRVYKEEIIENKQISPLYILKISGVWESFDKIGITYKFVEL